MNMYDDRLMDLKATLDSLIIFYSLLALNLDIY